MQVSDVIPADAPAFCTKAQLAAWLRVNPITLRRLSDDKKFPIGLRVSERVTLWKTEEVKEFLALRLEEEALRRGVDPAA